MIDLFSIIFQFFIFIFFSIMPFGIGIKYSYKNFKNLNFFETASINLLFLILILFLFSFLSFNLKIVYLSIIFIYALLGIFFIQDIIKYLKNNFFNYKFLSFLIIFLVISIDISRNPILGWDGLHIWVEKANLFYEGNNFLQVKENSVMKQYPHLGTYLWAFFWKNSIANYEYLGRLFYIFLYLLTIFVFLSSLKNIHTVVFLIIVLFVLFSSYDTGLGGYQTYLIYSLSTLYLYLTFNNRTNNLLLFFAYLSLFLLSWIKNEGAIYSMMLLLTFLFVNKFDKKILIHSAILTLLILIQFIVNKFFFNSHDTFQFNINI